MCQWKKNWCLRMVDSSIRYLVTTINHVMMIDVVAGGHVQQNLLWQHRGVGAALHELSEGGDGGESVLQWNLRLLWRDSAITQVEVSWTAATTQKRREIRREQSQEWQRWQTSERSFCQEQVLMISISEFRGALQISKYILSYNRRRLSIPHSGLSASRVDLSSFTHHYSRVVGIDSDGCDKDSTRCVICLSGADHTLCSLSIKWSISDFQAGEQVRRFACMHLFHVDCVDR